MGGHQFDLFQWAPAETHTSSLSHIALFIAVGSRPLPVFICLSTPFFSSIFLPEPSGTRSSAPSPRREGEINSRSFRFVSLFCLPAQFKGFFSQHEKHLICLQRHLFPPFISCFYTNNQTLLVYIILSFFVWWTLRTVRDMYLSLNINTLNQPE